MWKKFLNRARSFGMTRNETVVIVFLVSVSLFGGVLNYFRDDAPKNVSDYRDLYKEHDSLFIERSTVVAQLTEADTTKPVHAEETQQAGNQKTKSAALADRRININTASQQLLLQLPGVGPSTADKIIAYRKQQGKFQSIDEIMNVKGIGQKKFEKMKTYICVEEK